MTNTETDGVIAQRGEEKSLHLRKIYELSVVMKGCKQQTSQLNSF